MFGWGKPKKSPFGIPYPLIFKDAHAAVDYSSAFMVCKLRPGVALPAVVLGTDTENLRQEIDGNQIVQLRVAGDNDGFTTLSETVGPVGPRLRAGDLVLWQALEHSERLASAFGDARSGWIGLVVGTLRPELEAEGWVGVERFR